jgi:hypothetical protein
LDERKLVSAMGEDEFELQLRRNLEVRRIIAEMADQPTSDELRAEYARDAERREQQRLLADLLEPPPARPAPPLVREPQEAPLHYRRHEPAPTATPAQPAAPSMDEATRKQWDAWCRAHAQNVADERFLDICEIVGDELAKMLQKRDEAIEALQREIGELRERSGNVTVLRPERISDAAKSA